MKKELLIINSNTEENLNFINLILKKLIKKDFLIKVRVSGESKFLKQAQKDQIKVGRFFLGSDLKGTLSFVGFFLLLPFLMLRALMYLVCLRFKTNINQIILIGSREKIIFGLLAKILGFKIIWFELPGKEKVKCFLIEWLVKINLVFVDSIVVFIKKDFDLLLNSRLKEKVALCNVSVCNKSNIEEENELRDLRKFFNLGVITKLDNIEEVKNILELVKKLIDVVPNIRLTIVGDGAAKEKLIWISKTLGIERYVSFVGDQEERRNWFLNWDYLLIPTLNPRLNDFYLAINSMKNNTPVIAPKGVGFEDILVSLENRLKTICDLGNLEKLTKQIQKIEQERVAKHKLSELGREKVLDKYLVESNLENLIKIL